MDRETTKIPKNYVGRANFQCLCGCCSQPVYRNQINTIINPDGIVEVTLICVCGRKWYGTMALPEDFEVMKDDREKPKTKKG